MKLHHCSLLKILTKCCFVCSGWRQAQRFLSEPDLLISGHMFGLSCVKENYSQINSSKISHTSRLLAHVHGLTQVLSGLQLQIGLLQWVWHHWLAFFHLSAGKHFCLSVYAAHHPTLTWSSGGYHGDARRASSVMSVVSTATQYLEHLGKNQRKDKSMGLQWRMSRTQSWR